MKVLQCYRTYFPDPPGGLQEAIRQICLSTRKFGMENRVFCLSPTPSPKELCRPECQVTRRRSWFAPASCDIGSLGAFNEFSNLASKADILHYHFPWPFADLLNLATRNDKPTVLTYHSDIVRQKWLGDLYKPLMWHTLRQMQCIIATSPAYLETSPVLSHPSIREKVRIIPLGIDESSYPEANKDHIFHRLGLEIIEPYFLFVGVLRYYKGVHFLIKAAKGLGAKIVVAGSGPEETNLKALATESGALNVIFAGRVSDSEKVALLKHCRALVLPSHLRSEAFGMVLLEAQMFSRPLISCEIGTGTSYVNMNEKSGFIVAPSSSGSLHQAMSKILLDNELADALGRGARSRYENLFSGEALGRAYRDLYTELTT